MLFVYYHPFEPMNTSSDGHQSQGIKGCFLLVAAKNAEASNMCTSVCILMQIYTKKDYKTSSSSSPHSPPITTIYYYLHFSVYLFSHTQTLKKINVLWLPIPLSFHFANVSLFFFSKKNNYHLFKINILA